jgi:hypothetical protein
MLTADKYKDLKLQLDGFVPPGQGFKRNLLFDAMYASLPRDPNVKVQIYNAEIVPAATPTGIATTVRRFSSACKGSSRRSSRKAS